MRGRADYEGVDVPKVTAAVAALVLVLALAGCGESGASSDEATQRGAATSEESSASPEPLAAETPTAAPEDEAEQNFIAWVRDNLRPDNVIPNATDEQLVAAGQDGCEQIRADVAPDDLTVIDGEERDGGGYYRDSSVIITGARMFLCPDRIDG